MTEQHGMSAAIITGSSAHNEHIERLWHDVYRCVAPLFYNTFYSLEDDDKLDPNNEIDLYCLHYVYLPHINSALRSFTECCRRKLDSESVGLSEVLYTTM